MSSSPQPDNRAGHRFSAKTWLIAAASVLALLIAGALGFHEGQKDGLAAGRAEGGPHQRPASGPVSTVAFIGDSFTVGVGASDPHKRWSSLLADREGWTEQNGAVSGMGYVAGQDSGHDYPNQIRPLAASHDNEPGLVIVSGGWNDVAHKEAIPDIVSGADHTLATIRLVWPDARIVVLSPVGSAAPPPPELSKLGQALQPVITRHGATYLDLKMPLSGHPEWISPDGLHPNDAGYARLAQVTATALKNAHLAQK